MAFPNKSTEDDINASSYAFETRKLVEAGQRITPNTLWSYQNIGKVIEREVDGSTGSLQAAMRLLSRDYGVEFKNVRKIGYIRLNDEGIISMAGGDRKGINRRVKRSVQRSGNIQDWDALSGPKQREVDAYRSIFSALRIILHPSRLKRVRHEVDRIHDELDTKTTLEICNLPRGYSRKKKPTLDDTN